MFISVRFTSTYIFLAPKQSTHCYTNVYIFKLLVFSQRKVNKKPIFVSSRPWYGILLCYVMVCCQSREIVSESHRWGIRSCKQLSAFVMKPNINV